MRDIEKGPGIPNTGAVIDCYPIIGCVGIVGSGSGIVKVKCGGIYSHNNPGAVPTRYRIQHRMGRQQDLFPPCRSLNDGNTAKVNQGEGRPVGETNGRKIRRHVVHSFLQDLYHREIVGSQLNLAQPPRVALVQVDVHARVVGITATATAW